MPLKHLMAAECARADVRDERRVWHTQRQPRMRQQPHRLVFLDETYVNTKMTRLRGRSRRGQRLRMSAPFGHWKTHTFVAGLRCNELSAPWVIDGPITRLAFEAYIETHGRRASRGWSKPGARQHGVPCRCLIYETLRRDGRPAARRDVRLGDENSWLLA